IPFFYVTGGALVFLFLTWHIPSVAGSMMAGAVSLSLADAYVPGMLAGRAGGALLHGAASLAGAATTAGRWGADRLRAATATSFPGRDGPAGGSAASGVASHPSPPGPMGTASSGSAPVRGPSSSST